MNGTTTTMGEDSDSEFLEIQTGTTRIALGGPDHDLVSYLSNRGGDEGTPRGEYELEHYLKNRQMKGVKAEVEEEKMESVQSVAMEENSDEKGRAEKKPRRMVVLLLTSLLVLSLAWLGYFAYHHFEIRKEMKRDLVRLQTVKAEKQNLENEVAKLKLESEKFREERKEMKKDLDELETVKAEKQNLEDEIEKLQLKLQNFREEREKIEEDLKKLQTVRAEKQNLDNESEKLQSTLQKFREEKTDSDTKSWPLMQRQNAMEIFPEDNGGLREEVSKMHAEVKEAKDVFTPYFHSRLKVRPKIQSELLTIIGSLFGFPKIVDADFFTTNLGKRTPFALAVLNHHEEIENMMKEKLSDPSNRELVLHELKSNLDLEKINDKYKIVVHQILHGVITSEQRIIFLNLAKERSYSDVENAISSIPVPKPSA
jgi:predicted  nucleic acid-binding Zn-ribbon protein